MFLLVICVSFFLQWKKAWRHHLSHQSWPIKGNFKVRPSDWALVCVCASFETPEFTRISVRIRCGAIKCPLGEVYHKLYHHNHYGLPTALYRRRGCNLLWFDGTFRCIAVRMLKPMFNIMCGCFSCVITPTAAQSGRFL